jgi:hypothetical protein
MGAGQLDEPIRMSSEPSKPIRSEMSDAPVHFRAVQKHREPPLNGPAALDDRIKGGAVICRNLVFAVNGCGANHEFVLIPE